MEARADSHLAVQRQAPSLSEDPARGNGGMSGFTVLGAHLVAPGAKEVRR
jgi:hypothetical protein